ncbi:MAG: proline racemase family protein [Deltaproteobacteria bacterium]|jgi:proline racemase|nr:proline racemase family protein [Deltaproteobacteria bacterium]
MKTSRSIFAVDSHTAAMPTRIITGGIPSIPGATMLEKMKHLQEHYDHIRSGVMLEPRGHNDMFGSFMTAPVTPGADFGLIFMDGSGLLTMCGHGTIGASSVAVETGMVEVKEPYTEIKIDTPAGLVQARVHVVDGKAKSVSVRNVPAFLYKKDLSVEVPGVGQLKFDISFGGMFFAIIPVTEFGVELERENLKVLIPKALALKDWLNKNLEVVHPLEPGLRGVSCIEVYGPPKTPGATLRNALIFADGQVDRSPCGTGTSAKMATLVAKGELKLGEEFIYESIANTTFVGKPLESAKIGDYEGIIPQITGSAYITGFNHFVFDDTDPVKYGFKL